MQSKISLMYTTPLSVTGSVTNSIKPKSKARTFFTFKAKYFLNSLKKRGIMKKDFKIPSTH